MKFYLDADKIAVAMDKICSSLDKIARDNRQNSVKISRLADWIPTLPCYLMRAVFIARTKGGVALGFDTRTEAILLPIVATRQVGIDYARINFKFR